MLADWVGTQGQVKLAKKKQNTPTCDDIPRNPQIQNEKRFVFRLQFSLYNKHSNQKALQF